MRLFRQGDLAAAVEQYQHACMIVREMIDGDPDTDNVLQLGSMLYMLGQWQLTMGKHSDSGHVDRG